MHSKLLLLLFILAVTAAQWSTDGFTVGGAATNRIASIYDDLDIRTDEKVKGFRPSKEEMNQVARLENTAAYSLTFTGAYVIRSLRYNDSDSENNSDDADFEDMPLVYDWGKLKLLLGTRRSILRGLRVANARFIFESARSRGQETTVVLSGLDLTDTHSVYLQGVVKHSAFGLKAENSRDSKQLCTLYGWGHFQKRGTTSLRTIGGMGIIRDPNTRTWKRSLAEIGVSPPELDPISADFPGQILSDECGFAVDFEGHEINLAAVSDRVTGFGLIFIIKCLTEIRIHQGQLHEAEVNSVALRLSAESAILQITVESFEAAWLLSAALNASYRLPIFLALCLAKITIMAILFVTTFHIWRARMRAVNTNVDIMDVSVHILRFAAAALVCNIFMLGHLGPRLPFCYISLYLHWLPQIVADAWRGQRKSLMLRYVVGVSLCRMIFPIYAWAFAELSIFDGTVYESIYGAPSLSIPICIVVALILQVTYMGAQRYWGPRFLIPESWLPEIYDYYRHVPGEGKEAVDCVICMAEVPLEGGSGRAITPCDHLFHDSCLKQWLDVKLECPTCRGSLPPF